MANALECFGSKTLLRSSGGRPKQVMLSSLTKREGLWVRHEPLFHPDEERKCVGIPQCDKKKCKKDHYEYCMARCPLEPTLASGPQLQERGPIHHESLVTAARSASSDVDVVLFGDSLTELWNGTRLMGAVQLPDEYRDPFRSFFTKEGGGTLEGLALGGGGDTSQNLLWHLENGMLPDSLNPKLWMILIGTNDLGKNRCSADFVVPGILSVVRYVQSKRPETPILLHGLLPRGESKDQFELNNWKWKQIEIINRRLRTFSENHPNVYYMDTGKLFIAQDKRKGRSLVNQELLYDSLHPTIEGLNLWGPLIVKEMQRIVDSE